MPMLRSKSDIATAFFWLLTFTNIVSGIPVAHAGERSPLLSLPLDCGSTKPCIIQNYVDRQAGPEARDFMCGALSYDGHKGTDFRIPDLAQMRKGVSVRAAAAGKVIGIRLVPPGQCIRNLFPFITQLHSKYPYRGGDVFDLMLSHVDKNKIKLVVNRFVHHA